MLCTGAATQLNLVNIDAFKKVCELPESIKMDNTWLLTKAMRWMTLLSWVPEIALRDRKQSILVDKSYTSNVVNTS
jgi:hypothetical protein